MKADPAAQQELLQLAEHDTRTSQLTHQQKALPEHARIAELMGERGQLLEDYTQAETELSDLQRELKKAEADIEPVRARRVRDQERVDSGAVTDPKALRGLLEEIEHLGRRIGDLEEAELEVMEAADIAQKRFAMIAERRTAIEGDIRALMRTRDEQVKALAGQAEVVAQARAAVAQGLPAALVAKYDKVAANRGTGAAQLVQRRCTGCRLDIDAAELRAIEAAPADEVVTCDECGRILVR